MHDFEFLEARRAGLQARCDGIKSQRQRNEAGQFATPQFLAIQMAEFVRELWRDRGDRVRFLDPALGTGSLYSAFRRVISEERIECSAGVEIDDTLAAAAKAVWAETQLTVIRDDFTRLHAPAEGARYNLILTNPPYVRHHHLEQSEKFRLRRLSLGILGQEINGLAGLYCYFMLLAHDWLAPGGVAVWLVPSEFMTVNYGQAVRHYLTTKATLLRIHRYDPEELQFDDALVSSAVVVLKKAVPGPGHRPTLSYGGSLLSPRHVEMVPLPVLTDTRKWTAFPNADPQARRVERVGDRITLSDLFAVKRGIATGANRFFVLPREEAVCRGFSETFLKPILPSPRHLREAIIEGDRDGYPLIDRPLTLIDTGLPDDEIRRACRPLWEYLREGERQGLRGTYLLAKRRPWYKQEQRAPAPFLCTYMGRGGTRKHPFRFFWNKSRAVAPNVYLLLYPIGPLAGTLRTQPEHWPTVFELLQGIETASLIKEGRVYGGGLYKLEPKELARISARDFVAALGLKIELAPKQESLALS